MFNDLSKVILLSDMDGTLLNSRKQINETDMAAIEKFRSLGGKFTIATGRTIQTFEQYAETLKLTMPVIIYNGAALYDYSRGEILYSRALPDGCREMAEELLRQMPEAGGEVLRADSTYVFSNTEYQQLHTKLCGIIPEYAELGAIPQGGWLKILFAMSPEDISYLEILVKQLKFNERADFVRSSTIFLEMLPKGVSKGSALEAYRELDGMSEYTFAAIGDFDNDIEMIKAADFGVCPANAEESVKKAADHVLSRTNDEGAVAELIDHIIAECGIMNEDLSSQENHVDFQANFAEDMEKI